MLIAKNLLTREASYKVFATPSKGATDMYGSAWRRLWVYYAIVAALRQSPETGGGVKTDCRQASPPGGLVH